MLDPTRRRFLASTAVFAAIAASGRGAQPASKDAAKGVTLEKRKFGATDMEVTVLGFGGAEIGYQQVDQGIIEKLLNAALDAGLNVIDTAECYMGSEESIGKAVSNRRKEYYLFTKVGHMEQGPQGWTAASIEKSIDRSLERLKTDHIDLVQLHSCDKGTLEKGECIEALEKARKAGKTRYIGYSGDSTTAAYAVDTGKFDSLQTSCNICDQEVIDLALARAKARNMGVIAKRPIANAVWRKDTEPKKDDYSHDYWVRLQKLDYDFAKGDAKSSPSPDGAAGIALRFTLAQPVHVAIVGTSNPERWRQNAELLRNGGPLSKERVDAIRARWKEVAQPDWTGRT